MNRMLVGRHRALIERVAKGLLKKTTLTAVELDQLIGGSVDDVKANYAGRYFLAMARLSSEEAGIPGAANGPGGPG